MKTSQIAVFLDKDGTLVEDEPHNVDPDRIRPSAGAAQALAALHDAGYLLFVVSNQPGVAHGYFSEDDLIPVRRRLDALAREAGAALHGFYFCPHHPTGSVKRYAKACRCRKPSPGLITRACREHGIDPKRSWMIGDILDDVEAGKRAGCRTVMLDVGHETEWVRSPWRFPDHTAPDLAAAAQLILAGAG